MVLPDSVINYGTNNPLPQIPGGATQMFTADGLYNHVTSLLPGGMENPYAYGKAARISTQTQMAHPNRVALIVPKLFIPAPESDGHDTSGDPALEHAVSDGDLVFTFRMGTEMVGYGSSYCSAPYGHAAKSVPLMNLATVNYILWGLQVGMRRTKNKRWSDFFNRLTKGELEKLLRSSVKKGAALDEFTVWNFIRTYLRPFGIQHGGDQQGGMHEGNSNSVVTHGAVDYVSSYAIEGRLQHVNNLWRDCDVHENDDLVLKLRCKQPPVGGDLFFNLSSSVRSSRTERVQVTSTYFFLRPETLTHRSYAETCYIHIGRSFKYCSMYTRVSEAACWDARVAVVPGAPIMLTFEPTFVDSEDMFYASLDFDDGCTLSDSEVFKKGHYQLTRAEKAAAKAARKAAREAARKDSDKPKRKRKRPSSPSNESSSSDDEEDDADPKTTTEFKDTEEEGPAHALCPPPPLRVIAAAVEAPATELAAASIIDPPKKSQKPAAAVPSALATMLGGGKATATPTKK